MINCEIFNREYDKIYGNRFYGIDGTPYEYQYLEEGHYALRRRGKIEFVIVRATSPLQAVQTLEEINL